MLKTPVIFFVYKRLETTKRVFHSIREAKPRKLYLIADGPSSENLNSQCESVRKFVEQNIDWECNLIKIFSENNLGLATRISTGLDEVFKKEETAIILEDDTLPDQSFYPFCEALLERYLNDHRVGHISGCNLHPEIWKLEESYCFSSIINVWGWATWKRAWQNFDLHMTSWRDERKTEFLKKWSIAKRQRKGIRRMFDLHCENSDPWAWSYQWIYSCWKNDLLGIMPKVNLVSNLGIGPDATNTSCNFSIPMYPKILGKIQMPIVHPNFQRNNCLEIQYQKKSALPKSRILKNKLKSLILKFKF